MHNLAKRRLFSAFGAMALAGLVYSQISGGWNPAGTMPVSAAYPTATALADGTVLIAGGTSGSADTGDRASAVIYDPKTNSWTPTANMVHARYLHAATRLNDARVLVVGGTDSTGTAELYDPAYRTWSATGNLKTPRYAHTASLLPNGVVLVAGGCCDSQGNTLTSSELWDPRTGQWTMGSDLGAARAWHTATHLIDGRLLLTGGTFRGTASVPTAEFYDPLRGTWIATGSMAVPRSLHTANLLADGRVLVTGGNPGGCCSGVASAELFDPGTQKWQTVQSMSTQRRDHAAAVLSNGISVLVSGGYSCCLDPNPTRGSAEAFDESTLTWRPTGSLLQARYGHTLTTLGDGTVLTAGGAVTGLGALATAERYQPGGSAPQTVQVTIGSNVTGASFTVENPGCSAGTYASPATLTWNIGANCTVNAVALGGYLLNAWSDGATGNPRIFVAPVSATTYTATFNAAPPVCTYSISPKSQSFGAAANTGSVKVVTTSACGWSASSNAPAWLTITSGATGTGRGTLTFSIKRNTGSTRVGVITWLDRRPRLPRPDRVVKRAASATPLDVLC